jgi:hypothetical protein
MKKGLTKGLTVRLPSSWDIAIDNQNKALGILIWLGEGEDPVLLRFQTKEAVLTLTSNLLESANMAWKEETDVH